MHAGATAASTRPRLLIDSPLGNWSTPTLRGRPSAAAPSSRNRLLPAVEDDRQAWTPLERGFIEHKCYRSKDGIDNLAY